MPTVVADPLKDLVTGLVQAHGVASSLRREAMAKQQMERENQLQDLKTQMLLSTAARPVDPSGTVADSIEGRPLDMAGLPDQSFDASTFTAPIQRKADKGNVVKWGGREYELKTRAEQIMDQMQENAQLARSKTGADIEGEMLRRDVLGNEIPGLLGRYLPGETARIVPQMWNREDRQLTRQQQADLAREGRTFQDSLATKRIAAEDARAAEQRTFQAGENEKNRKNRLAAAATTTSGDEARDVKDTVQAVIDGKQPPVLTGLYRNTLKVRGALGRAGYDVTTAQKDWQAVQKHIATLNGAQQERLRQAVTFTYDSLDQIENLYDQWTKLAPASGFKVLNKAALASMKQLPGEAGAVATSLEAQINDLTAELGTVYKGGNASTDESLRLAAENLKADWNKATFKRAIDQVRTNLRIRKNSIMTSQPVGVSPNSPYLGATPAEAPAGVAGAPKATHRFNPATGKIEPI